MDIQESYRSHRDTHVGSLFGLKQTPGHHGKMPVHCLFGTERKKSSQVNIKSVSLKFNERTNSKAKG